MNKITLTIALLLGLIGQSVQADQKKITVSLYATHSVHYCKTTSGQTSCEATAMQVAKPVKLVLTETSKDYFEGAFTSEEFTFRDGTIGAYEIVIATNKGARYYGAGVSYETSTGIEVYNEVISPFMNATADYANVISFPKVYHPNGSTHHVELSYFVRRN